MYCKADAIGANNTASGQHLRTPKRYLTIPMRGLVDRRGRCPKGMEVLLAAGMCTALAAQSQGAAPYRRVSILNGGATAAEAPSAMVDEDVLRREYERYKAAVERPLTNFDEPTAQRTRAVRLRGLLSREDIEAVHRAASAMMLQRAEATIDRSAWGQPAGTWHVTFLNTAGFFEAMLPDLYARIRQAAIDVDRAHWNVTEGISDVNYRVVEYHTMLSTINGQASGGGLHTQRHCDHGSLITVDILLTDPSEIKGGVLQTLESDGELLGHSWEQGDALVFLSHKYHCVSELTQGTRQVMVLELWEGTENHKPSRDEGERWLGAWKEEWRES